MTTHKPHTLGISYAVLAALCNATIGIFTNLGIRASLPADTIAFYRCVGANGIGNHTPSARIVICSRRSMIQPLHARGCGANVDFRLPV